MLQRSTASSLDTPQKPSVLANNRLTVVFQKKNKNALETI